MSVGLYFASIFIVIIGYVTIQKRYKGMKNNPSAKMINVFSLKKELK
jgi:hypothetical protein